MDWDDWFTSFTTSVDTLTHTISTSVTTIRTTTTTDITKNLVCWGTTTNIIKKMVDDIETHQPKVKSSSPLTYKNSVHHGWFEYEMNLHDIPINEVGLIVSKDCNLWQTQNMTWTRHTNKWLWIDLNHVRVLSFLNMWCSKSV